MVSVIKKVVHPPALGDLASSRTNCHAYRVWVHSGKMNVCSNTRGRVAAQRQLRARHRELRALGLVSSHLERGDDCMWREQSRASSCDEKPGHDSVIKLVVGHLRARCGGPILCR